MTSKKENLLSWLYEDYIILRFLYAVWLVVLAVLMIIQSQKINNLKVLHELDVQQEVLHD